MNNRHTIRIHVLLLASLLVSGNALAVDVNGAVFGGGNMAGVTGNTSVTLTTGTVAQGVYGGCNSQGTVGGAISVNINGGTVGTSSSATKANVHGGGFGSATATNGNITVIIGNAENTTPAIWGDVYGGSALGSVNDATSDITKVWLKKGTVNGSLYGGGLGDGSHAALVNGSVQVVVDGGVVIDSVFGANNVNGTPKGSILVTINAAEAPHQDSIYALNAVYGGGNLAAYLPTVTTTPATVIVNNCNNTIRDLFGGGNAAAVSATSVTINGGEFDRVFAGGNGVQDSANVIGNTSALIKGGTIRQIFGGSNIKGSIGGTINVEINKADGGCDMHITELYGGGNQAASKAGNLTIVRTGSVDEDEGIQSVYGGANDADVTGDITLNITGGRITKELFGGNNTGHTVTGNITINVEWDDNANGANDSKYLYDVFGGGNRALTDGSTTVNITNGTVSHDVYGGGSQANVKGAVTVNIGDLLGAGTVNIGRDVYGGGALASTNTGNQKEDESIKTDSLVTTVNLYPGATIGHDVYGGGLGRKEGNGQAPVAALVYGNVDVTQYGAILNAAYDQYGLATSGRIFGCNNVNGTPKGHVRVYVVKTTGKDGQLRTSSENYRLDTITSHHTYELAAVYGGGNEAAYEPADTSDFAEVIVSGCNDISIHSVYGGGNAASTPATKVTVDGAYEIEYVFGGGNGAGMINGLPNPGANVGYRAYPDDKSGPSSADITSREGFKYGSGIATTAIYGGRIHNVYGGSNTKGNVRQTAVSLLDEISTCPLILDGIYGGGREAYMEGATSLVLGCITGMNELYGGSEKADVGGNVALTITSGHFGKVFGGNNKGGRIFGSITVNVEQTGCVPITIDTIYLGGNNAPYSVYGYGNDTTKVIIDGDTVTHYNLKDASNGPRLYDQPKLNIRSFKTIGTVFGGGNGGYAKMIADPTVDINVTEGWVNGEYLGTIQDYSSYKGTPQVIADCTIGTVYGGGNVAEVDGNTNVLIGDKKGKSVELQSMVDLYVSLPDTGKKQSNILVKKTTLGGDEAISYTPYNENNQPGQALTKANEQPVIGATITGNVYGGGNNAHVTGKAYVQIGPDPNASQVQTPAQPAPQRNNQPQAGRQPSTQSQTPQTQSQNQNTSTESLFNRTATPNRR